MKTLMILTLLLASGTAMAQPAKDDASDNGGKKPPTAKELIAKLDKDGDGKISKSEFDGPEEHFTMFDVNKDEYLTEEEIPTEPPAGGKRGGRR